MARFKDFQDEANPLNGLQVSDSAGLRDLLNKLRGRAPFVFQLEGANGTCLLVGMGGPSAFVQFTDAGDDAVAMAAVAPDGPAPSGDGEFLCGGTLSPIPAKYCMPLSLALRIAERYIEKPDRDPAFAWEPA